MIFRHVFTAIPAVACILATTFIPQATSDNIQATSFLGEPLGKWGAFNQPNLKIVHANKRDQQYYVASGKYAKHTVIIRCQGATTNLGQERIAYELLRKFKTEADTSNVGGQQFVADPLHDFSFKAMHCFVMSDEDQTLESYTKNMSNSQKIAVLPRILNQVLRGVNYLHKAQLVHGDISTTNIRVTKPILGKPSVLITGFGHSKHITSDELTTIQVTAKYNMSPESILQIPCNLRKHDTWAIGATIFKTLYGKYPYQHFAEEAAKGQDSKQFMQTIHRIRDSGISLLPVITENGAKFKKLAPLYADIKMLLSPRFEERPTPKTFIAHQQSLKTS